MIGKFKGTVERYFVNEEAGKVYALIAADLPYKHIMKTIANESETLSQNGGKELMFSVSQYRKDRTVSQNRMMWALLEKMSEHLNGGRTGGVTAWDCYVDMLEKYGAKFEYIMCVSGAVSKLKSAFRAVKEIEHRDYNGVDMVVCKCFYGSSSFNTKEMSSLIDGIIDVCYEFGIYDLEFESLVTEWRDLKNE